MSTTFSKKVKAFTEVVAETSSSTVRPSGVILANEVTIPVGRTQRYRVYGYNPKVCEIKQVSLTTTENLIKGVTPTSVQGITYNSAMNDGNESTYATYSIPAPFGSVNAVWDLGSAKHIYVKAKVAGDSYVSNFIEVSLNGTDWFSIVGVEQTSATYIKGCGYARYVRWSGYNSYSNAVNAYVYDITVLNIDTTTYTLQKLSDTGRKLIELTVQNTGYPTSVIALSDAAWTYYVYYLSEVKVTLTEGELV